MVALRFKIVGLDIWSGYLEEGRARVLITDEVIVELEA